MTDKNDLYQPTYAYIRETGEIVEYHLASNTKEGGEEYIISNKEHPEMWEFIGYGFQVYTFTKTNWINPELAVGQFPDDNRAYFRKKD